MEKTSSKFRVPTHWTRYRKVVRGAITEAVKSYFGYKSKIGIEKALEELILDGKSLKDVARQKRVAERTLSEYMQNARALLAKVLGQEAVDPELEAAITSETSFEELKYMLSQMNKADETTAFLVIDKPVPETVSKGLPEESPKKDLPVESPKNDHSTNHYALRTYATSISSPNVENKMLRGKKRFSDVSIGVSSDDSIYSVKEGEVASKKTNVIYQENSSTVPIHGRRVTFAAEIIRPASPETTQGNKVLKGILKKQKTDDEKDIAQNTEQAKKISQQKMMHEKWMVKTDLSNRLGRIESAVQNLSNVLHVVMANSGQNAGIQRGLLMNKMTASKTTLLNSDCDYFFPLIDGDCALLIDGKQIRVNKALLSIYSKYFEDLFYETAEPIAIEDVDYDEFILLLKHIYPMFKKDQISETNVESLLKSAVRFQVMPVVKQCEEFLKECAVDKISVCKKLVIAQTFGLEELQSACIEENITYDQLGALQKDAEYDNLHPLIFKAIVDKLAK